MKIECIWEHSDHCCITVHHIGSNQYVSDWNDLYECLEFLCLAGFRYDKDNAMTWTRAEDGSCIQVIPDMTVKEYNLFDSVKVI